ncbi:MAG: hypothetical protein M1165_01240 [Candidatus Pacearchaeota archaeon]|nr:hypothetical protein [Candidatus Pacearchaeota archaeon]
MPRKKEVMKEKRERNPEAFGISGFTLSIISLVMLLFSPLLGVLTATIGIIFCGIQQSKHKTRTAKRGMIISLISLALNIAWWIIFVLVISPHLASLLPTA